MAKYRLKRAGKKIVPRIGKLKKGPPKTPHVSVSFGRSTGQKINNKKIVAVQADNARVHKIHAEGAAASKRARARASGGGGGQRRDRKGRFA